MATVPYEIRNALRSLSFFGAGDEARTRYLHLGKVALYRMSYTRISVPKKEPWCLRSESNQRHADFQSAALPTELQRRIHDAMFRRPKHLRINSVILAWGSGIVKHYFQNFTKFFRNLREENLGDRICFTYLDRGVRIRLKHRWKGDRIRLHFRPRGDENRGVAAIELAASNCPPDSCILFSNPASKRENQ